MLKTVAERYLSSDNQLRTSFEPAPNQLA